MNQSASSPQNGAVPSAQHLGHLAHALGLQDQLLQQALTALDSQTRLSYPIMLTLLLDLLEPETGSAWKQPLQLGVFLEEITQAQTELADPVLQLLEQALTQRFGTLLEPST